MYVPQDMRGSSEVRTLAEINRKKPIITDSVICLKRGLGDTRFDLIVLYDVICYLVYI